MKIYLVSITEWDTFSDGYYEEVIGAYYLKEEAEDFVEKRMILIQQASKYLEYSSQANCLRYELSKIDNATYRRGKHFYSYYEILPEYSFKQIELI